MKKPRILSRPKTPAENLKPLEEVDLRSIDEASDFIAASLYDIAQQVYDRRQIDVPIRPTTFNLPSFAIPAQGTSETKLKSLYDNMSVYTEALEKLSKAPAFEQGKAEIGKPRLKEEDEYGNVLRRIYTQIGRHTGYLIEETTFSPDGEPLDHAVYFRTPVEDIEPELGGTVALRQVDSDSPTE